MILRALAMAWLGVAIALGAPSAHARVAPDGGEQRLIEENAEVYALARSYFPSDAVDLPSRRIFRLTRDQIDLAAKTLLGKYVTRSIKDTMPRDPLQTNYEYAELIGLNAANWGALTGWIGEIAAAVRNDASGVIACPGGAGGVACHTTQARAFARRAFRGDPGGDRIERVVKFYLARLAASGEAEAAGDLVEVVLNSPDFLFRKELATDTEDVLKPSDRLTALSFMLADVPPEKLGLDTGRAERLLGADAEMRATIGKIVASAEARAKLKRFFKAWLELKEPAEFTISRATFPEFTPEVAEAMLLATDRMLAAALAKPAPKLSDITMGTEAFVSKPLEAFYGLKAAAPEGVRPVAVDPAKRLGIFSEPAVIASHSGPTDTRLVKRGVFWVRKVMCMELDPPPPGTDTSLYSEGVETQRAKLEAVTAKRACIGCHKKIDPFGFFQENYDALGRWRTTDNGLPVDAAIAIDFLDEEKVDAPGPVAALKVLVGSAMFKQCFVRQVFRYYTGRSEETGDDPLLRRMFFGFANHDEQSLLGLITTLAEDERMRKRR